MTAPIQRVALLGFGRFGRALSWLLEEAGVSVRASDPVADVPSALRAPSLEDLIRDADAVIAATPVSALASGLATITPFLRPDQLVMDVGSVKTHPEITLRDVIGEKAEWVATHPLFGPASLARGERPMRVVVCPNDRHPGAAARARALYERIGCEVIEKSAEEHDRIMARTHVLTFFIAKGLMDAGAASDEPLAPPSFQALHRALQAVRIDAGHLFFAIQHENPFAALERRKLIDALRNVDEQIEHTPAEAAPKGEQPLAIPDLGKASSEIMVMRDAIDAIDHELIDLLARRKQISLLVGDVKASQRRAVHDPKRERELLEDRVGWATEAGLDAHSVREIFDAILRYSRTVQRN
jgi:prephenate dehydrogenase